MIVAVWRSRCPRGSVFRDSTLRPHVDQPRCRHHRVVGHHARVVVLAVTKRTWPQLWDLLFATVWVTGFGTGVPHDTLPVNLISAERDLSASSAG